MKIGRLCYRITIVLAAVTLLPGRVAFADAALPEYQVKAVVVYKVAKFVSWPSDSFPSGQAPVVMCIAGDDPFGQYIDDLNGHSIHGRPMIVRRVELSRDGMQHCHIVFVGDAPERDDVLEAIAERPVLTIGDTDGFAKSGGMLGLNVNNNRVVFEINMNAVKEARLNISASLLQLATIVESSKRL